MASAVRVPRAFLWYSMERPFRMDRAWGGSAHVSHPLADDALFFSSELHLWAGDVDLALQRKKEVYERYPQGNKVSDAMLKAGQSLVYLGDIEGARTSYRVVARRFPGTAAAAAAEERLARLP